LSKYNSFGCTPQGRELEKQFREQFADSLPFLSHEIALATKRLQEECEKFLCWYRNETIKCLGNSIVPQVAYQLLKSIDNYENTKN
jgi:hypothetical protein